MTNRVEIELLDHVHIRVIAEPAIMKEISEEFTFDIPGAKFMPAYKNKFWDGKIRLFNMTTGALYTGLYKHLVELCEKKGYEVDTKFDASAQEFSLKEAKEFIDTLGLPEDKTPRDYQIDAFAHCVRNNRALLLSPTASGKSLIIYLLIRFYLYALPESRVLIVVPTTSLVSQMASDFDSYGLPEDIGVHRIFSGQAKHTDHAITITTWQSIYKLGDSYFRRFNIIIGDEAHNFQAKSLTAIMTKTVGAAFKFGTTGTLDGSLTNKLVLEGLFGPVYKVTTTKQLMDAGHVADLTIKAIVLKYDKNVLDKVAGMSYQDEIDYIVRLPERNRFIKNLALSLKGNVLILFNFTDKHGKILHAGIEREAGDRKVFYVDGGVNGDEREEIRKIVMAESNAIIVASYGTFSTGVNIPNIHNVIFASPSKSRIRNLQSIGRGLRLSDDKEVATLFDIADDFTRGNEKNYTLRHFVERIKIYAEEKFKYKIYPVKLKVKDE